MDDDTETIIDQADGQLAAVLTANEAGLVALEASSAEEVRVMATALRAWLAAKGLS